MKLDFRNVNFFKLRSRISRYSPFLELYLENVKYRDPRDISFRLEMRQIW